MDKEQEIRKLTHEMQYDLKRYPLPICFDPDQERTELFHREQKIKRIVKRYFSIKAVNDNKTQNK